MEFLEISKGLFPLVGVGFLLGCMPLVAGLFVQMLINVMKRF